MNQKETADEYFLRMLKNISRNRLIITTIILLTFLVIMVEIGLALLGPARNMTMSQEWKEILLLVLGAFIASYSKIIDFWFNNSERDLELIRRADDDDYQSFRSSKTRSFPTPNRSYDPCEECEEQKRNSR